MDSNQVKGFIKTADLTVQNFKLADKKDRIIEGFFTTTDLDRGGDISLISAFDKTLPEYMKNPILTFMHDVGKVMGKVLEYKVVEDRGIWIKAQIAKNVKWVDEEVWPLMEQGIIKGFSYGYSTKDSEEGKVGGSTVNFLKEVELYEIAVVTLPMNANALFDINSNGEVKSMRLENAKEMITPETKKGKQEEELNMEKLDQVLDAITKLSSSVETLSTKADGLGPKMKEISAELVEATALKIKELQDADIKAAKEQEDKTKLDTEQKESDTEVLDGIKEVNSVMLDIVKLLTPKQEEK